MSSLPLKGMPFDRDALDKSTRVAFDEARRIRPGKVVDGKWVQPPSKPIGWAEARRRGYLHQIYLHFPSHVRRTHDGQGNLPSV